MFKHTGIVRRIDEAGRIAIPKEVRRKYRIHDGDPIEIGEGENMIMLKKYSVLELFDETTQKLLSSFAKTMDIPIILCNTTNILYAARIIAGGPNASISQELSDYLTDDSKPHTGIPIEYATNAKALVIEKICIGGYVEGALIIPATGKEVTDVHRKELKLCADAIAAVAE